MRSHRLGFPFGLGSSTRFRMLLAAHHRFSSNTRLCATARDCERLACRAFFACLTAGAAKRLLATDAGLWRLGAPCLATANPSPNLA